MYNIELLIQKKKE